jgi:magnesium-transporting ATPase (P-type)
MLKVPRIRWIKFAGLKVVRRILQELRPSLFQTDYVTVPSDYDDLLAYYTQRGFRVIACATKHIAKLNWVKVQKMKREEAESELDFVGFIIFENKLKPSTAGVLDELTEAGIRKVMCTGDNILTAISVARECNLIDKTAHCFVPHFSEGKSTRISVKYFANRGSRRPA